eukprot:1580120-Pyramimonas_sp.AAC.1
MTASEKEEGEVYVRERNAGATRVGRNQESHDTCGNNMQVDLGAPAHDPDVGAKCLSFFCKGSWEGAGIANSRQCAGRPVGLHK